MYFYSIKIVQVTQVFGTERSVKSSNDMLYIKCRATCDDDINCINDVSHNCTTMWSGIKDIKLQGYIFDYRFLL